VVVDAKDEAAHTFYARYGYAPLLQREDTPWPRRLFLPLATLRKALDEEGGA
jgi:hypothetical protein